MLHLTMTDQVERDLPLDRRPSWNFGLAQRRLNVVSIHANMYPSSRLRIAYRVSIGVAALLVFGPFFTALIRSCVRGK